MKVQELKVGQTYHLEALAGLYPARRSFGGVEEGNCYYVFMRTDAQNIKLLFLRQTHHKVPRPVRCQSRYSKPYTQYTAYTFLNKGKLVRLRGKDIKHIAYECDNGHCCVRSTYNAC